MTAGALAVTSLLQAEEKGRARDKAGSSRPVISALSHWLPLATREAGTMVVRIDALPSTTVRVSVLAESGRVVARQPTVSAT